MVQTQYLQMDDVLPAEWLVREKVLPEFGLHVELLNCLKPVMQSKAGLWIGPTKEGRAQRKTLLCVCVGLI